MNPKSVGQLPPAPRSALATRRPGPKALPRDVDVLTRAVNKVGPVGLGGVLRELGVSAA